MLSHDVLEERDDDAEELVGVRQEIAPNEAPGWPPATRRLPENKLAREDVGHAAVAASVMTTSTNSVLIGGAGPGAPMAPAVAVKPMRVDEKNRAIRARAVAEAKK